jgi:leucyl aminopeptidase
MWPMPLPDELRASMDSEVADIANMGDKYGGMLVAGVFLREFVADGVPWAHLDIAGPRSTRARRTATRPREGPATRAYLVRLAEDLAAGRLLPPDSGQPRSLDSVTAPGRNRAR